MKTQNQKYEEALARNIEYRVKNHMTTPEEQKESLQVIFHSLRNGDRTKLLEIFTKASGGFVLHDSAQKYGQSLVMKIHAEKEFGHHRRSSEVDFSILTLNLFQSYITKSIYW